ncbi:hypothetical protein E0H77_11035 [Acinetobacter sp. ANC 4633]|nr:hypothetical protein E0H77_11035 [Acinetobacter sp. ANC 4633]
MITEFLMMPIMTGVAQAIALFVLLIWIANYKTDVFLLVSICAMVLMIGIGFLLKFEPTKPDSDMSVESKTLHAIWANTW